MALRLRRLKIERFRDVRPGTELHFSDGWNVLLGRNGSGKTTLLHLISMVLRDDLSEAKGEEFAIEYDVEAGDGIAFTVTLRNTSGDLPWTSVGPRLTTSARLEVKEASGRLSIIEGVDGGPMRLDGVDVTLRWFPCTGARFTASAFRVPQPYSAEAAYSANLTYRIDEGVSMFGVVTGRAEVPRASVARQCRISFLPVNDRLFVFYPFVPASLKEKIEAIFNPSRITIEFDLRGDPTLERFASLLGFAEVAVVARPVDSPEDLPQTQSFGHFEFYARRDGKPPVPHDHWSFGQQRLLTIFWYLACNPDVVVADELVNGLHWEWIAACVEAIGDRQVFVAVQNPLLLEHVRFDSPEDVQRAFVMCRSEPRTDGGREMVWVQPDARQAESFHRAWSSGIQPVHEVLKTEGLW